MTPRIKPVLRSKSSNKEESVPSLMLYNDDIHSFEYVIESLIEVCSHSRVQAEQCTMITHYKGQCEVKRGDIDLLKEMRSGLTKRGLKASINKN